MSHIVESCPLTKLNGGLSRLHSADEDAVSWLMTRIQEKEEPRVYYVRSYQSAILCVKLTGSNPNI